jgi:Tfp pilus assembly protein PilV
MPIPRLRARRGGTLIELLVALLLLDMALLSLAAISALAARRIGEAGRLSRSVAAATNRLERLMAGPCPAMTAGSSAPEPGVSESWDVREVPGGAEVSDSVDIRPRPATQVVLRVRIPC